jgi:hypothetical protein
MRRAGAPASMPTDDRGNHLKGRRLDRESAEQWPMVSQFNCTLPPAGTGGRAEHRAVTRPTPVAAVDSGPPLGGRQEARREHPSS